MARNRQTPLKDEQEYNVDNLYQKLDDVLTAIKDRNLTEAKKLWNMGDKELVLYALSLVNFNKSVADAMDAYLKAHQGWITVENKQGIPEDVKSLLTDCRNALRNDKRQQPTTTVVTSIEPTVISTALQSFFTGDGRFKPLIAKPEPSTKPKSMMAYLFFQLPWYYMRLFWASPYTKWWGRTILLCSRCVSVVLTCIIAHDNAQLRETKQKYVLLREFCRPDKDMATKADYIELLYSDKEEYKKDIDLLWEQRRKRLCR